MLRHLRESRCVPIPIRHSNHQLDWHLSGALSLLYVSSDLIGVYQSFIKYLNVEIAREENHVSLDQPSSLAHLLSNAQLKYGDWMLQRVSRLAMMNV